MENTAELLAVLFLVALTASLFFTAYSEKKKRQKLLQGQADKRNGYIEPGNFLRAPRLILPIDEQALNIYYVSGGRKHPPATVAELTGTFGPFPQITVSRKSLFQKIMEFFGKKRFLIGNKEFDKLFITRTTDESAACQVLTTEVQKYFLSMAEQYPYIGIDSQYFQFMVMSILEDAESYDLFIDMALAIWKKLRE